MGITDTGITQSTFYEEASKVVQAMEEYIGKSSRGGGGGGGGGGCPPWSLSLPPGSVPVVGIISELISCVGYIRGTVSNVFWPDWFLLHNNASTYSMMNSTNAIKNREGNSLNRTGKVSLDDI